MSIEDLLSQDEIDALLHGVATDEIETHDHALADEGEAALYDFANQERVIRGRMPSLEMVNERYARNFRNSLFKLLRRGIEVTVAGVQMLKYSEYVYSLVVPTSLNVVKIHPLRGNVLLVIDPKLVFTVVDNFFGGDGRLQAKIEGRDFAPTELRLIQRMMEVAFDDMTQAWKPVMEVELEYISAEVNPQFANIVGPNDVVVVTNFQVEIEGVGGEFHVAIPCTSLEPVRDRLDTVLLNDSGDSDERWTNALRDEIEMSTVNLSCRLAHRQLSLRDILELKPGDVIPVDLSQPATICAEGIPVLRGRLGATKGNNSVTVTGQVRFPPRELRSINKEVIDER
ncbi:MAG: flagellar motor switch protein FliM [Gammaproteobacteria bacterium]|nr:flagellar motor switch protein FliM [Gammaproteobacteria bacterium]